MAKKKDQREWKSHANAWDAIAQQRLTEIIERLLSVRAIAKAANDGSLLVLVDRELAEMGFHPEQKVEQQLTVYRDVQIVRKMIYKVDGLMRASRGTRGNNILSEVARKLSRWCEIKREEMDQIENHHN